MKLLCIIGMFLSGSYCFSQEAGWVKTEGEITEITIHNGRKRKDSYFSLSDFMSIIKMSPFNQEERFNTYIKVVDPVSKLVLESIGFDPNIIKTYKDDDSIAKYMNEYVMGDKVNIKLEKKDMINYKILNE